ncbi:N-acetyltransferase [Paraglaciecola sp. 2405UD69-4]|uniref:N-acetyltransferase n=1 Tax=Paraglaciecola sp. 2405UD69-4 TaxID=3391836 RepID=UPI0039C93B76
MIRKMNTVEVDTLVSLWFKSSVKAHNFIPEDFWQSQILAMKESYLPNSDTYIYEENNHILGFISYHQGFVPALFVSPNAQSQGVGSKLLNFIKQRHNQLQLAVYVQNHRAHSFYQSQGFKDFDRQLCEQTEHEEILMEWRKT